MSDLPNKGQSRIEAGSGMDIKIVQENEASPPVCPGSDHLKALRAPPSARNPRLCVELSQESKSCGQRVPFCCSYPFSCSSASFCSLCSKQRNFLLENSLTDEVVVCKHEQHKEKVGKLD